MKTEFLVQMDGLGNDNEGVLILAATNLPWSLDPAVRRRFQKRIHIPLPDMAGRKQLFQIRARGEFATELQDEDFEELARRTEGFSGSDINIAHQDALGVPIKKVQTATHFKCVCLSGLSFTKSLTSLKDLHGRWCVVYSL
jgi:vacuolar protein-sorting-associated protein 4